MKYKLFALGLTVAMNFLMIAPAFASEKLPSVMANIAKCESGDKQFTAKGKLVRDYATGTHIGRFQLSVPLWNKIALKKGWDIYTRAGNTAMALYLYKTQGVTPWLSSSSCWQYT